MTCQGCQLIFGRVSIPQVFFQKFETLGIDTLSNPVSVSVHYPLRNPVLIELGVIELG